MLNSILIPLIASTVLAAPHPRWIESKATCVNFYANVPAVANTSLLSSVLGGPPANEQTWIQYTFDSFIVNSTLPADLAKAPLAETTGNYSLYFEYCAPTSGEIKGIFQTVHGLLADHTWWNLKLGGKTDNSFAESAAAAGWATLSYDRLGVGRSDHPDPLDIVQGSYESAQVVAIASMIRSGDLPGVPATSTLVGLGHSYGSIITSASLFVEPEAFNATILTGYTGVLNDGPLGPEGFGWVLANYAYPERFGHLSNGYLVTPTVDIDQLGFFHYPNYTEEALDIFTSTKGEVTIGELKTDPMRGLLVSEEPYSRPLLWASGEYDGPNCSGNCSASDQGPNVTALDYGRGLFPNFTRYDIQIIPDTAHGINFHTTAFNAFQDQINWAQEVLGLA